MDDTTRLQKVLKDNGRSITKQRVMVFTVLQNATQPMTIMELSGQLPGLDKVSVYRAVELFENIGLIHRVWNGFKSKIELSEAFSPHHHHFTCLKCGKTIGLKSEKLEQNLIRFEQEHGFELTHHSVELSGYCQACKQ